MRKRDELIHGCMAKARDDEMTFVLLGRDVAAPAAIRAWIAERIKLGKNRPGDLQITEAEACARTMETERSSSAPRPLTADEFYILSIKWSLGDELVWWKPNNNGYTCVIDRAGRYTRDQVETHRSYYDNGVDTRAVPCAEAEALAVRVVSIDHRSLLAKINQPG